jgi:two-component system OmpR family sensor kinase
MTSLRTRVLISVLLLSAVGMIALAAVTYAEQRSFLLGRIDQQVRAAAPAVSYQLDVAGYRPPGSRGPGSSGGGTGAGRGRGARAGGPRSGAGGPLGGPNLNLPPGTYGQRREASGKVLGHVLITYEQGAPPAPKIPASLPAATFVTVGSVGSSGLRYRAYLTRDPEDSGLTVVAVPLREMEDTLSRLLLVEVLVISGVLAALGASAFFVVRLGLRPLLRIETTAGQIAAGDLSRRVDPATPRTEVGRLGLALNAMLERLEQAFAEREASQDRLRQFLADASHELRTPLAAIRGYAELFRMGATRDAAGTELAMRRIEDESRRMGVLVEDLLTLARLDEAPTRVHERVDMAALARDAVQDARATAPEREITLTAPEPARVRGDSNQLRQVLANLIRNALEHTPSGSPIEVEVRSQGASVTVAVRDHGRGLPHGPPELLFERFWRAEGGRERGKAGAGLGLAIVSGLVKAHGGDISARDAPGGGALFVVRLPRDSAAERAQAPAGLPR